MSNLYIASLSLLLVCVALAIWRGALVERLTVAILVFVWVTTSAFPFDGVQVPWAAVILDGLAAAYLIYLAIFSGRSWPAWAAAFQLLVMANHLAFFRFHEIQKWAYISGYYLWTDAVMIALATGILLGRRSRDGARTPADG